MLRRALAGMLASAAMALPAAAQDAYVVGVSGALTGPPSGTNAPPIEGLRLYIDRLNAAGGVNGRKIQLVVLDDQAEPSKAAANAKRLLTQDNVKLLVLSSLSSTFAPVIAETKRANVPLLFMGAVCPKEVYPPADPLQFCTTAYAGGYESRATLAFIKETAKGPVRIGFAAMAIPVSRGEIACLLGPNGAGKTTLIRTLLGVVKPVAGTILFDGERIDGLRPDQIVQRGIGVVPEGRRVFPRMTVDENLRMGAFREWSAADLAARREHVFTLFPRLAERRDQKAATMSLNAAGRSWNGWWASPCSTTRSAPGIRSATTRPRRGGVMMSSSPARTSVGAVISGSRS